MARDAVNGTRFLDRRDGRLRIKICCIASIEEAQMALDAGADAVGLVSAMPSGPGVIGDALIAEIIDWVGSRAATVLLTSRLTAASISEQLQRALPTVIQLVDTLPDDELTGLRAQHSDVLVMPVIHVQSADSIAEAVRLGPVADALLLDSGNPTAIVKELGGTGHTHDWRLSSAICQATRIPVFLAGGLRADNVAEAVRTTRPFGVDVCSGVRRDGRLNEQRLTAFITEARAAQ